tara:strand:+ start:3260 stop:4114 length:855 start_codon:yes stop_codon:yes gene_type:complete
MITKLSWNDIAKLIEKLDCPEGSVWGIPRGGAVVAGLLQLLRGVQIANSPAEADWFVDDLIDSGRTRDRWTTDYFKPFLGLINKQADIENYGWIEFPWEESAEKDAEDDVTRILEHLGEDVTREGLQETPTRVVRSWSELYSGYSLNPNDQMKWFKDDSDEMVVVRGVHFYSTCEHHMLPFYGKADIAYIPNGAILGVSKMARLVDVYARRLQVQERLARQVGEALQSAKPNPPLGVAVHMIGKHLCMMARGVKQQESEMETNYLTGVFRSDSAARAEFFSRTK